MAIGLLIGGLASGAATYFGSKAPKVAKLEKVNPSSITDEAVTSGIQNLDKINQLTRSVNEETQSQAIGLFEKALPGYRELSKRFVEQANKELDNQYSLPPEVADQIRQFAAERGATVGASGNFQEFSVARDFGLNLLQYGQQRQQNASSLFSLVANLSPRINPASPLSFLISPQALLETRTRENDTNQGIQQSAYNAEAERRKEQLGAIGTIAGAFGSWYDNRPKPIAATGG